jgi:hypothetical protein
VDLQRILQGYRPPVANPKTFSGEVKSLQTDDDSVNSCSSSVIHVEALPETMDISFAEAPSESRRVTVPGLL